MLNRSNTSESGAWFLTDRHRDFSMIKREKEGAGYSRRLPRFVEDAHERPISLEVWVCLHC